MVDIVHNILWLQHICTTKMSIVAIIAPTLMIVGVFQEDVVYQFSASDSSKLVDVRGLFITLSHMLLDVTNNTAHR